MSKTVRYDLLGQVIDKINKRLIFHGKEIAKRHREGGRNCDILIELD